MEGREEGQTYEIGRSGVDLEGEVLLVGAEIDVESVGAKSKSDTAERLEIRSGVHVERAAAGDAERNDLALRPSFFVSHHRPSLALARPRRRHPSSASIVSVVSLVGGPLVCWVTFWTIPSLG